MSPPRRRSPGLRVEPLEVRDVPAALPLGAIAVGAEPGDAPDVTLIDPKTDAVVTRLAAYEEGFRGGVSAALADVTGDGVPDLVAGPGAGGGPRVQIIDGTTGEAVFSFFVYEETFAGGISVAVGDVDGDDRPEIVTGTGAGGGPRVRTFSVQTDGAGRVTGVTARPEDDFFAYEDSFRGGVLVATGDVDGDGVDEIICGTGVGGGPRVRAVRGTGDRAEVLDFFAFEDSFRNGVRVASGDVDGDGRADVLCGTGEGGGSRVRAVGAGGAELADFLAFAEGSRDGVRPMACDTDGDGRDEIVAAARAGVKRFDLAGRVLGQVTVTPAARTITRTGPTASGEGTLTAADVDLLLKRAAAASASRDGIIVVTDRNGRPLGVRVEGGVSSAITSDPAKLVFAVDGALAKARTGAFFGNNQGPLTSRTVQFISQSTITDREVNADPSITDPNSTARGPGFVAPVGIKGHFPPNRENTPQVDLFGIEHTNRDGTFHVGEDGIKGTDDDVRLAQRFNIDPAFVDPGQELFPPDSFGFESGLNTRAQARGIATQPGGLPIYKNGEMVGGIGVFFPGATGFATEENSSLSTTFDPAKPDRSLEAEWVGFAAVGGFAGQSPVGDIAGVPLPAGVTGLPFGRIDLVGITLDIVGPLGPEGVDIVRGVGAAVGAGSPDEGRNIPVDAGPGGAPNTPDDVILRDGLPVPDGWLVNPHDGVGITAAEVERIITRGIAQANETRAAIRLPLGSRTRMVFAVADLEGNIVGLFRMKDATVFSIDVAVAKARNVAYYADPLALKPEDQLPGVAPGTAFTNRTFRYLAHPRFPISVEGTPPAPFSQLNDAAFDGVGRQVGAPAPASAFDSVYGFDSFNPGTNFRDDANVLNQNGIVFFPGSAPLYRGPTLIGGFGVSGDGVDQDDVVTAAGAGLNQPPDGLRIDETRFQGIRLPYQKFNRNPEG